MGGRVWAGAGVWGRDGLVHGDALASCRATDRVVTVLRCACAGAHSFY